MWNNDLMPYPLGGIFFLIVLKPKMFLISLVCVYVYVQAAETNWVGVMENLDHEGFYIPNENAFTFFMTIFKHACQVCEYVMLWRGN